jgi:mitochondrial inner membrane protease ATP23
VTFMTQHIAQQGISVDASNIVCRPCNKERSGGFSPGLQEVLLCQDGFHSKKHMEDTLVHELIHLYDHAKFKVDWNDLRHVACSEVRSGCARELMDKLEPKTSCTHIDSCSEPQR